MMLKERFRNALKTTLVMHFKRVGKLFFRKVPESECLRFAGHAVLEQLLDSAAGVWKGGTGPAKPHLQTQAANWPGPADRGLPAAAFDEKAGRQLETPPRF